MSEDDLTPEELDALSQTMAGLWLAMVAAIEEGFKQGWEKEHGE